VEVLDLFEVVLNSPYANSLVRQYTLTALCKFAIRLSELSDPSVDERIERVRLILQKHSASQDLEIQQRSVEFESLFTKGDLMKGVLEHMPAPEIRTTIMGTGTKGRVLTSVWEG
jgi:AP-1 complex subunit gamma-1